MIIRDAPDQHRYEIHVSDDELAGFVQYRRREGLIALIHTEIDTRFAGRGLASALIESVLDEARSAGVGVLPFCPFVNAYIVRHPAYVELVPEHFRAEFGLTAVSP